MVFISKPQNVKFSLSIQGLHGGGWLGWVEVQFHSLLTSETDEDECSAYDAGRFTTDRASQ